MIGRNVTVAAALTLLSLLPAAAKTYRAERYLVQLELNHQGELQVNETAVFRFADGPFTYVYRDISARGTDGISNIAASFDGHLCPIGKGPGEAEIDGTLVRWHFAPSANEAHTFVVTYTARGVIRKSTEAETLIWRALPPDRSYKIDHAQVSLTYPPGIALPIVSAEPHQNVTWAGDHASVQFDDVRPRRDFVLTARFAADAFAGPPAQWLVSQSLHRTEFLAGVSYGAILASIALLGVVWWIVSIRSAGPPYRLAINPDIESAPPSALSPALAGRLAGRPASPQAVLLDLARRGAIRVEESKPGRFRHDYLLILERAAGPFSRHEEELIQAAFGDQPTATLTHFRQRIAASARKFRKAIREGLVAAGLYDTGLVEAKSRLLTIGSLLMGATFAAALLALLLKTAKPLGSGLLTSIALALALSSLIVLIAGAQFSPLSQAGAAEAQRWKSFARYLGDMAHGRVALPSVSDWEHLLPFAAALNVLALLVRHARKQGSLPLPAWFGGWQNNAGGDAFVGFLNTSSAGYGGGADAGAGAASGGGSSGAG